MRIAPTAALRLAMVLALAAFAAACAAFIPTPAPLPADGPIAYRCDGGAQLMVDVENNQARVAIIGGPSMVLPNVGSAQAPYYTNGRYSFRGGGAAASWQAGGAAPVDCRGG